MQADEPGEQILELHAVFIEFRNWNDVCRRPLMPRRAGRIPCPAEPYLQRGD
jgi:hypothetical protein